MIRFLLELLQSLQSLIEEKKKLKKQFIAHQHFQAISPLVNTKRNVVKRSRYSSNMSFPTGLEYVGWKREHNFCFCYLFFPHFHSKPNPPPPRRLETDDGRLMNVNEAKYDHCVLAFISRQNAKVLFRRSTDLTDRRSNRLSNGWTNNSDACVMCRWWSICQSTFDCRLILKSILKFVQPRPCWHPIFFKTGEMGNGYSV